MRLHVAVSATPLDVVALTDIGHDTGADAVSYVPAPRSVGHDPGTGAVAGQWGIGRDAGVGAVADVPGPRGVGHDAEVGAVASFVGLCRDEGGRIAALELEHYPGMAEAEMARIAEAAAARWRLAALVAVHRTGVVPVGAPIVVVAAAAAHRDAAFDAARFVMDFLKTDAPFWKREHLRDGTLGPWVEAAAKDDAARTRWS